MTGTRIAKRAVPATLVVLPFSAGPAYAAGGHAPVMPVADVFGIGHALGGVFGGIGHAVLGAFSWTFGLATKFILVTLGAIVKLLIPRSWANQGVQIMQWIVEVPNYVGKITSPTGQHVYGFAGINELRDLFTWIGMALLPLTLVYSTSRAMLGQGDHVAIPITRVLVLGAALISYPYWWSQSAALVNQLTHTILSFPAVTAGLHKLMLYAVDGAALGGWQLVDLGLMAAIAIELLGLIFLKVAIVLLGALLYATGPVTIGLIPTDAGAALTRAWASAAITLLALPVVWAAVFAVGALLINDAGTAGPLLAGHSDIGSLLGGTLLAVAGLASLWLCLRAAREAGGLLRVQVGGEAEHQRGALGSQLPDPHCRQQSRELRGDGPRGRELYAARSSGWRCRSRGAARGRRDRRRHRTCRDRLRRGQHVRVDRTRARWCSRRANGPHRNGELAATVPLPSARVLTAGFEQIHRCSADWAATHKQRPPARRVWGRHGRSRTSRQRGTAEATRGCKAAAHTRADAARGLGAE